MSEKCHKRKSPALTQSSEKWMRRARRTSSLNVRQRCLQVILGQSDPELVVQHAAIFVPAFNDQAFDFPGGVPHIEPCIEQSEPRTVRARQRRYDVVEIR